MASTCKQHARSEYRAWSMAVISFLRNSNSVSRLQYIESFPFRDNFWTASLFWMSHTVYCRSFGRESFASFHWIHNIQFRLPYTLYVSAAVGIWCCCSNKSWSWQIGAHGHNGAAKNHGAHDYLSCEDLHHEINPRAHHCTIKIQLQNVHESAWIRTNLQLCWQTKGSDPKAQFSFTFSSIVTKTLWRLAATTCLLPNLLQLQNQEACLGQEGGGAHGRPQEEINDQQTKSKSASQNSEVRIVRESRGEKRMKSASCNQRVWLLIQSWCS